MALVELRNIYKRFNSEPLLDNVTFSLEKGSITTLLGQNGAGKTTIAKLILGFEKANKGTIKIAPGTRIGYVPQKLDVNSSIPLTCSGLISLLAPDGSYDIPEVIEFAGYDHIKKQDISNISGGQLQRLLIAGTILSKPELLIFDEPTKYLDVTSQEQFYKLITLLKNKFGMTIFMISHDLFTVMKNSDQVICLNKHICCSGKPAELSNNPELIIALSEIAPYIHHHNHSHR